MKGLHLYSEGRIRPLPVWARWFIDLGAEIFSSNYENERLTVAVSLPNRGFASVLTGLGMVHKSFEAEVAVPDDPAIRLNALKPGTAITLIDLHNKIRFARVIETQRDESGRLISIKYDRNGRGVASDRITRLIDKCTGVDFSASEDLEFQQGRPVGSDPKFTGEAVGASNLERFICHNRKSCLIIGEVKSLVDELTEKRFAVNEEAPQVGSLFDLLRPRLGNQDQPLHRSVPARSHIVRAHGNDIENRIDPSSFISDACTVFDGGLAYQNHRDAALGNSVVFVNRWAAHAFDSVSVFRSDRAMSTRDANLKVMRNVPEGIEIAGFWSRR